MSFKMNTTFIAETVDRSVKSFAQAIVLYLGGGAVLINGFSADWLDALGFGLGAAVLSLATSLVSGSLFKNAATPASILSTDQP
jgi:hypothetical protein